ncbi:MAG: acetyl-CoA C-acetyltransferase [Bdellovibrionales bacterium]|nr:acetyl-CoA C-acetyltransferase [Bdellovibrionales bacterium]
MRSKAQDVYILGSSRIPFVKSQTAYNDVTRKDLMVAALNGLVDRHQLQGKLIGDVSLGAVMNSSKDFNLAREAILSTALHPETPAYNTQRACGTGLEAAWQIALKAHTGAIDLGIAGGVDTNSDIPIEVSPKLQRALLDANKAKSFGDKMKVFSRVSLGDLKPVVPNVNEPRTLMSMGEHCEIMVKEWKISRAEQDEFAFASHKNGAKAYETGFYEDLVVPFHGLKRDGPLRGDTSLEKLAKLKPSFDPVAGSLTAGNSSPLTDGAASVLLGNADGAAQIGAKPLAKLVDVQVAAVDFVYGAGLLMAPTKAIAQLLIRNKLTPADFDYFELHEAFAGQVLCNLKALEDEKYCKEVLGLSSAIGVLDRNKMNTVGSSLSLGHPFAATGARIVGTLAKLISQNGKKRGLISICTAGGMGIAAILESA